MNIRKKVPVPKEDVDFFKEIANIFKKYPGSNNRYSIRSNKSHTKLVELMQDGHKIRHHWEGNKMITQIVKNSDFSGDCCCVWGVDDDGNTFCQESGDDCC